MDNSVYEILKKLKKILDSNKVIFWLRDGSVLGIVRDKELIKWDTDVDIGIWWEDFEKLSLIDYEMKHAGYKTHLDEESLNIIGKDFNIDIATHKRKGDFAYHYYIQPKKFIGNILDYIVWILSLREEYKEGIISDYLTKKIINLIKNIPFRIKIYKIFNKLYVGYGVIKYQKSIPLRFFENLKEVKTHDISLKIPKDFNEYLTYRYGEDWRTPRDISGIQGLREGSAID